jgi:hypothetical protein
MISVIYSKFKREAGSIVHPTHFLATDQLRLGLTAERISW